jgi:hypothetical protein
MWDQHPGRGTNKNVYERFTEKIFFDEKGCWLWQGALGGSGYGMLKIEQIRVDAHVFSYTQFNGLIPQDKEIDHLCGTKNCVNPDHLEAVSHLENCRRRGEKITHCLKGHEYTEQNTILNKGNRQCRTCTNVRNNARYHRSKI